MAPNCDWIELTQDPNPLRDDLALEPIQLEGGRLRLPDRPGLGVELDEKVVERYRLR
jgi:D-galactarolactone cycloisomerase